MAKLKEPSAMTGTFTRSRSEIFLHRTRSGRARSDPNRHAIRLRKRLPTIDPPKDLRLKRIFSVRTATGAPDANPTADIDSPEKKTTTLDSDPSNLSKNGSVSSTDLGHGGNSHGSNGRMKVDRVEMTLEMQSSNRTNNRFGPSRCSRSKLIGNQSSFSYKRLLPYLKDLAKEDSSGMEILCLNNHSINAEKPTEDKLSFTHADSLSNQQNHIVPLEDSSTTFSVQDEELKGALKLTSQINVLRTLTVESSDSFSQRKLGVEQVTCNMNANDNEMEGINKLEKKANSDFEEHHDQEHVCQATPVESPYSDSYKKRKLQVYEATCETGNDDHEMGDIYKLEEKETSEKIIGGNAEIMIGRDDNVQGTPPGADLISKLDDAEGGKRNNLLESELCNESKDRLVPALSSRLKLFRNPSSFSYRRLLPYIMDLAKDGLSGMTILHPIDYTTKAEKKTEKRPYATDIDPSSALQHQTKSSVDSQTATSTVDQQSEQNPDSERHCLSSQESVHNPVAMALLNELDESKLQISECKSELPPEKADDEFEMLYKSTSCPPTIGEDLSVQELAGDLQGLLRSPLKADRNPLQGISQFESSARGGNRSLAPRRGILKKQTRGCRGICTCLDCASFRVHAEKGFEFSRKQMSEADEVVEGLMKELSCLRNMVGRFLMPVADYSETYNNLQLSQEQIKGVCQRALRVEEAAKNRMREMILDLNTHCRIPGPRVSFSEYVEKQNI